MKKILQDPTTRLWFLSGLTGILLMAGVLLGEGQARTATPSPVMASIQANKLTTETVNSGKSHLVKSIREQKTQKTKEPVAHKQVADKNPAKKKRMGLAMLFWGILADES